VNIPPTTANRIIKDFDKKQQPQNFSLPQKIELKQAIIFVSIVALIKSFLSIYLGYRTSYIIFIVAFGVAYYLRLNNPIVDKKLGIAAASVTLLFLVLSIIVNWILLFVLYRYSVPFSLFEIFSSFFRGLNILNIFVILAATGSFVLASNENLLKNLYKKDLQKEKNSEEIVEKKQISDHKKKEKF